MKEYAIIVAGGKGTRFGSELPKQFLELAGRPVLLHSVEAFRTYSPDITIILVLSKSEHERWRSLTEKHNFRGNLIVQDGGDTRFQSVRNGLKAIVGNGLVAVHDGVRPLVTPAIIERSFQLAAIHNSAVASVALKESLRKITEETKQESAAVERSKYRLIQTPQTFSIDVLRKAYSINEDPTLTDDASVVERAGVKIFLFEGSYTNLKITNREDLDIAETLLKGRAPI